MVVRPVHTGGSETVPERLKVLLSAAEVDGGGGVTEAEGPGHDWAGLSSCFDTRGSDQSSTTSSCCCYSTPVCLGPADLRCAQVFWSSRPVRGGPSATRSEAPPTKMSESLIFFGKKVTTYVQPGNPLINNDNKKKEKRMLKEKKKQNNCDNII